MFWIQCGNWYERNVVNVLMFSVVARKSRTSQLVTSCQGTGAHEAGRDTARATDQNWPVDYSISYVITLSTEIRVGWEAGVLPGLRFQGFLSSGIASQSGHWSAGGECCIVHLSFGYSIITIFIIVLILYSLFNY